MASLFTRSFVALLAAQASFGFSFSAFFLLPKYQVIELVMNKLFYYFDLNLHHHSFPIPIMLNQI